MKYGNRYKIAYLLFYLIGLLLKQLLIKSRKDLQKMIPSKSDIKLIFEEFCEALEINEEDAFETENNGFEAPDPTHYETNLSEPFASYSLEEQLQYLGYQNFNHWVEQHL
jgi:hypothetical protein